MSLTVSLDFKSEPILFFNSLCSMNSQLAADQAEYCLNLASEDLNFNFKEEHNIN